MTEDVLDAFIVFNEKESSVEKITAGLEARRVKTYFKKYDVPPGEWLVDFEAAELEKTRTVVLFLGAAGWGYRHSALAEAALKLGKRMIPVLIGDPPRKSLEEFGGYFAHVRYLHMRQVTDDLLDVLAEEILSSREPARSERESRKRVQLERIISELVDGNEVEREWALKQVIKSDLADKKALSERLREEISIRFHPDVEKEVVEASRDPKRVSSIRSWMMSCLIWADSEAAENRKVILDHLQVAKEPDRNVRFWTLAGLYNKNVSYLSEALQIIREDPAPEVRGLQEAIATPNNDDVIYSFRNKLNSPDFRRNWEVLRVLRVVPLTQLTDSVCKLMVDAEPASARAYDSLYALSNPQMAPHAVKILSEDPGVERTVELVITVSVNSNRTARRNFCGLLSGFDSARVDTVLRNTQASAQLQDAAAALRQELSQIRTGRVANQVFVAGYDSDAIDIRKDHLEIQEDVQTLVAVMLAKEVQPPLAIGLFGDWGTGKSFFMQSMKAAVDELARKSTDPESKFCSNIAQIEFNAWHYIDANLWASLVSHILEQLSAYVAPEKSEEEQQAVLLSELSTAKTIVAEAEAEKAGAQAVIDERQAALQELQLQRREAEVKLSDLRLSDLANLLSEDQQLKTDLTNSLNEIGAPVALEKLSDLSNVISEAHSLRGRAVALFLALIKKENKQIVIGLTLFVLVIVPLVAFLLHRYVFTNDLLVWSSAVIAQVTGIIVAVTAVLRRAFQTANSALARVEGAKRRVDELLAEKRQTPSAAEKKLQNDIATLKAKEEAASARVVAAAARVVELEGQIRAIKEGRSLARFLGERVRSEDYRKHLGLISTIRKDFESLAARLLKARETPEPGFRAADRIILYIDDLDRCPTRRVMEVLQAVHLLLAYPLFIVVVGVDPRWLLHSLGRTYGAFNTGEQGSDFDVWKTTPQNYLEKIFQIPFNLRPMSDTGYSKLVSKLLIREDVGPSEATVEVKVPDLSALPQKDSLIVTAADSVRSEKISDESPASETVETQQSAMVSDERKRSFQIQDEALVIREWEANFAVKLFPLIPNPRATKRFSNIYRILKAHVRRDDLREFEGTAALPGDFQVTMLLLALLIGSPDDCAVLFPKLMKWALDGKDVIELLQDLTTSGLASETAIALSEKLKPIIDDPIFPNRADVFLEWLPRVSRFSFEVGRVLQPVRK